MKLRAYAKVNLGLEVLFHRQDGYHELRTIFQTIDLYDSLTLEPRRDSRSAGGSHRTRERGNLGETRQCSVRD